MASFLNILDEGEEMSTVLSAAQKTAEIEKLAGGKDVSEDFIQLQTMLELTGAPAEELVDALTNLNTHFDEGGVEFEAGQFDGMTADQISAYKKIARGANQALSDTEEVAVRTFESGSEAGGEFGTGEDGADAAATAADAAATAAAAADATAAAAADATAAAGAEAAGVGDLGNMTPGAAADAAEDSAAASKAGKTGGKLSKAWTAVKFAGVGTLLVGVGALAAVGINDGSKTDNPDHCPQTTVEKQACEGTIKTRQEYHEMINGVNKFMDILFDAVSVGALYGIFGLFVVMGLFLMYQTLKNSYKKNTGTVLLYGIPLLFFVSIVAFPYSMWFFTSPRQKCTKPTTLATVDPTTCPIRLQAGSCFVSSPNELDTYLQNPCIIKSFLSSPTYTHDYNILINGERVHNSLNYVEMYDPNDLPWEWKLPKFQEASPSMCQYYKHGSPIPDSTPPQITCSSPSSATDIDDTSVGSYKGEPSDGIFYVRVVIGISLLFIILCLIYSSFKSADSQAQEHLEKGRKFEGPAPSSKSAIELAAEGFAEGLEEEGGGNQGGGFLDTKKIKKLNKYNKWLIVFLLIFAMIITHYYKKQRGTQKDQQYIQQYKEYQGIKEKKSPKQKINNNDQSNSGVQPYQPSVFGGQYL
jgi:preprotein translocase subunit SecG